jgi:hypothetical protein
LNFNHREAAEEMNKRAIDVLRSIKLDWIEKEAINSFLESAGSQIDMANRWTDLLVLWFNHFRKPSLSDEERCKRAKSYYHFL